MTTGKRPQAGSSRAKSSPKASSPGGDPAMALEGGKAPPFELSDGDGAQVSLRDLIGRAKLVLYFYPKDMTPGCTTEACGFRDRIGEIRALGAEVVGVSGDPIASHQRFIGQHGLNFPLLSDPGFKVASAYRVYRKKSLYGREFMGIVRSTFVIDRGGTIRRVFAKVKVNGHTDEVLAALAELG